MAPILEESTSNSVGKKKKTLGRKRVEMKKVEAPNHRHVTFSKRKKGLFQKADTLSSLAGTDVAVVVISECGRAFGFGTPSCDSVADRYLAGLSPNQNAKHQNHRSSCQDDSGFMILGSIPSTSSNFSLNENVHHQNNGVVDGTMIVQTTPSMGSPIRGLEDDVLPDSYNLDLVRHDNADYRNHNVVVGSTSTTIETAPSRTSFLQSDGVDCVVVEPTPLSSSFSEIRVLDDDKLIDEHLNLMNETVSPAEPCENLLGNNGESEAGEMSKEMIEEMIEEMMNDKEEVPGCNEFLTKLVRALLPTTASNYYTSMLVVEDEDELLVDNKGLGTCYFNPYDDWRCGGIYH